MRLAKVTLTQFPNSAPININRLLPCVRVTRSRVISNNNDNSESNLYLASLSQSICNSASQPNVRRFLICCYLVNVKIHISKQGNPHSSNRETSNYKDKASRACCNRSAAKLASLSSKAARANLVSSVASEIIDFVTCFG